MSWIEWYDSLAKPSWTPAPATISLIWQILYPVILVSFGYVFVQAIRGKVPRRLALPFAVNLVRTCCSCRSSLGCGRSRWQQRTS